jgi:DNA-directed RNA polymerase I, II, and III subunit RPABC2
MEKHIEILDDDTEEELEDDESEIEDLEDDDIIEENEIISENLIELDNDIENDIDDEELEIDDIEIDNIEIINKKKRKTFNILTKYEKNYLLGIRSQQIMNGSPIFVDLKNKKMSIFDIAYQELIEKKIPFKIKRKLPNGIIEIWDLKDLKIL